MLADIAIGMPVLNSPGIMWLDLDKIATKGFSTGLSSTRSHNGVGTGGPGGGTF